MQNVNGPGVRQRCSTARPRRAHRRTWLVMAVVTTFLLQVESVPVARHAPEPSPHSSPLEPGLPNSRLIGMASALAVLWLMAPKNKRRHTVVRQRDDMSKLPRIHSNCLQHFNLRADERYARLVFKLRQSFVSQAKYERPTLRDTDRRSGRFNPVDPRNRVVKQQRDKALHVEEALQYIREHAQKDDADVSPAMVAAISTMLDQGASITSWRENQLRVLIEVARDAKYLDESIRSFARSHAPGHVVELTGPMRRADGKQLAGFHFGILCVMVDALEWPDDRIVYNLAMGFPILHKIPDSGVYRSKPTDIPEKEFEISYAQTMSTNLSWLQRVDDRMSQQGRSAWQQRDTPAGRERLQRMQRVEQTTLKEVADNMMTPGMPMKDLVDMFTDDKGQFTARVMSRHGVYQGVKEVSPGIFEPKLRCIDDAARSSSNACTFMVETITTPSFAFPAGVKENNIYDNPSMWPNY